MRWLLVWVLVLSISACQPVDNTEFLTLTPHSVAVKLSTSGILESSNSVTIGPPLLEGVWNFTISSLVAEGSHIVKGQTVLKLDSHQQANQSAIKSSELSQQRKALKSLHLKNIATLEKLKLKGAEKRGIFVKAQRKATQALSMRSGLDQQRLAVEYQLARLDVSFAESNLAATRRQNQRAEKLVQTKIKLLQQDIKKLNAEISAMSIRAPKNGIAMIKSEWNGNRYTQNSHIYNGNSVLEIPDLTQMCVRAWVAEQDSHRVKLGQQSRIILDAIPERIFSGTVTTLGSVYHRRSTENPQLGFNIQICLSEKHPKLFRPGMGARVDIIVDTVKQALEVDPKALLVKHGHSKLIARTSFFGHKEIPVKVVASQSGKLVLVGDFPKSLTIERCVSCDE